MFLYRFRIEEPVKSASSSLESSAVIMPTQAPASVSQDERSMPSSPQASSALSDIFTSTTSNDDDDVVSLHSGVSDFSYSDVSVESTHAHQGQEQLEEVDVLSRSTTRTLDDGEYDFVDTDEETEAEL